MGGESKFQVFLGSNPILYIAFPVELAFANQLLNRWEACGKPVGVTNKPPEDHHLTLAYLSEVQGKNVEVVVDGIEHRLADMPKREFLFHRFEIFPAPKRTYAVARADVAEIELWHTFLRKLRKSFQHTLAPRIDDRPWAPHVSIGTMERIDKVLREWTAPIPEFRWKPMNLAVYAKMTADSPGEIIRTFALP